ncbi:uncharacterized protein TNCV_1031901 [Trichonephila clavipes]|nr:uncharacterized protein TNCV_1031901 [Trichonephila clavipes]
MKALFCIGASDDSVLVRRKPGERLQPNSLHSRHTGPSPAMRIRKTISYDSRSILVAVPNTLIVNLYINLVIQPIVLTFMNSTHGLIFQQDNRLRHTVVVVQRALQSVEKLLWPARSSDLSPIKHVKDIFE